MNSIHGQGGRQGGGATHLLGGLLCVAVLAALTWRLPLGIDLSDESYYVIFIDDWLKGGIQSSTLTTLHQTALLAAYLPLRVYTSVTGSTDGLVLVLRVLFLTGSVGAALAWLAFLLHVDGRLLAWLGAAFALSFIPFGLPSVSYNTLGMQGLAIAVAALGVALVQERPTGHWAILSAVGWAVAVTAYPSMVGPLAACLLLLVMTRRPIRAVFSYTCLLLAAQAVAWGLVAYALSLDKLLDSIAYLSAINDVAGWSRKLAFSLNLLQTYPTFATACAGAFLLGLLRNRLGSVATSLLTAMLVGFLFTAPHALFCRSHDVVTVVALTGIGHLFKLGKEHSAGERATAFVWVIGFVAGLTTMASAFNSLFNFPVGGAVAAVAALSDAAPRQRRDLLVRFSSKAAVIAGVLFPSLTFYYGDLPDSPLPSVRVESGAFAGLLGQPEQVDTIRWMRDEVSPLIGPDYRIAFVGRLYGLILATPARPLMLAVFPLDNTMNPRGLAMSRAFFENPAHRASLVVIETDEYITPLNPIGPCFPYWYEPLLTENLPLGHFQVFRRVPESSENHNVSDRGVKREAVQGDLHIRCE